MILLSTEIEKKTVQLNCIHFNSHMKNNSLIYTRPCHYFLSIKIPPTPTYQFFQRKRAKLEWNQSLSHWERKTIFWRKKRFFAIFLHWRLNIDMKDNTKCSIFMSYSIGISILILIFFPLTPLGVLSEKTGGGHWEILAGSGLHM